MRNFLGGRRACAAAVVSIALGGTAVVQAETVRIGLINTYSGPLASQGDQVQKGVDLFLKLNGAKLPPGVNVEILKRDDTGISPAVAKRLAQELVTRDKVHMLTGVLWTPNAAAIAPVATQSRVPFVIMNAATSMITTLSPYIVRTSMTLWQSSYPMGQWAAKKYKKVYIAVSDYGPGHDAQEAFTRAFTEGGGEVVGTVRMAPSTVEFAPFLNRIKNAKPDAVFVFIAVAESATAFVKGFDRLGLAKAGINLVGTGDIVTDEELPNMGDSPIGLISMFHYSSAADRPANKAFVEAFRKEYGSNPSYPAVGAWDGMQAIFDVINAQSGKIDPEKTVTLLRNWKNSNSPRGPIAIDPATGDIVQNEYVRETRKVNGSLANIEIETIPAVKDPWKELRKD